MPKGRLDLQSYKFVAFGDEHGGARGRQRPGPRRPFEERPENRITVLFLGYVAVDALLAIKPEEAVIDPGESVFGLSPSQI